jgi:hypothetical protein
MLVRGYLYESEEQCQNDIDLINIELGFPDANFESYSRPLRNDNRWFLLEDDVTIEVLGQGIEFELIQSLPL